MTVVFGHPTGNQAAHNAALAHFEAGWLEQFCVPWMPTAGTLAALARVPGLESRVGRFSRRNFPPLEGAPKSQGQANELLRLILRELGVNSDVLADQANVWLMKRMSREIASSRVTAAHAYEDCSLLTFERAKQLGKACIYSQPAGYFPAWDRMASRLFAKYADWLPPVPSSIAIDTERKRKEMELADVVLASSNFVARTVLDEYPHKAVRVTNYGIDIDRWATLSERTAVPDKLAFLYAGQCSVLKGIPLLIEAWKAAGLSNAELNLVGGWRLAPEKKRELPPNCYWRGPVSGGELREIYGRSGVFVFPTNFEGFGMVVLEAMAAGLPVAMTAGQGAAEFVPPAGRLFPAEDLEALVETLRWFDRNRDALPGLSQAARHQAEACTWEAYRHSVVDAVRTYV